MRQSQQGHEGYPREMGPSRAPAHHARGRPTTHATASDERSTGTTGLERLAYVALLVFLVVLYSNVGVVVPELTAVQPAKLVAVVALAGLMAGRLARRTTLLRLDAPQTVAIAGLLSLAACSVYGALWPTLAAQWCVDFLKMVAVYLLIVHLVDHPTRLRRVATTLIVCSLVPAVAAIRRALAGSELVEGSRAAWVGFFADPNELAYSLVILVPLTVTLFHVSRPRLARAGFAVAGAVQVMAVVATQSRGGLLGLAVVVGLLVWRYRARRDVLAAALLVAVVGVAFASDTLWRRLEGLAIYREDGAIMGRLEAWRVGWAIFLDRWGWGVGIGNFALAWPLYADTHTGKWITAHNAFIQVLGELGAVGVAAFVALLAMTVVGLRRAQRVADRAGDRDIESFAGGLELALWGYVTCGMLLSVAFSWFLYLIIGLSVAVIAMAQPPRDLAPSGMTANGRVRPWD